MSETAFKAVRPDLTSPFIPWRYSVYLAEAFSLDTMRITYEVGGTYDAVGIQAVLGYWYTRGDDVVVLTPPPEPPVDIRDPANKFRGIMAFPSLESYWLRPYGADPVAGARYLQLEYDVDDVLGTGSPFPEALSLARVHVVAEVTP